MIFRDRLIAGWVDEFNEDYLRGYNAAVRFYENHDADRERVIAILRADVKRQQHVIEVLAANQKESR